MSHTKHSRHHKLKGATIKCDGCQKMTPLRLKRCVFCGKAQF